MAHRAIHEYDGKKLLARLLPVHSDNVFRMSHQFVKITKHTDLDELIKIHPWLVTTKLAVKADQLVKRRYKNNLVILDVSWVEACNWIDKQLGSTVSVDGIKGTIDTFIVEPFYPHHVTVEHYLAIRSNRWGEEILFSTHGGIDVGDIEAKAQRVSVNMGENLNDFTLAQNLLTRVEPWQRDMLVNYINTVYKIFQAAEFVFLEINPLIIINDRVVALDLAAQLDDTAGPEAKQLWGSLSFPPPFGKTSSAEEEYIRSLDENSGASLKLTVLKPEGRIWTLLAGGGASVVFTDTIADLGYGHELANYGEYSGNPTDEETYEYSRTVLDLMTRQPDEHGRNKVLIIGGGIANFTDVAKTFSGISKALREYKTQLKKVGAKIYVRRGGPNYQEGIRQLKALAPELGIPFEVYGPETHMTRIVKLALQA